MARDLTWFKFSPVDWMMGRIQRQPDRIQLSLIKLMCLYWHNQCQLTSDEAEEAIGLEEFKSLIKIKLVSCNEGRVSIATLDKELAEASQSNSDHWNWKGGITEGNRKLRNSKAMRNWRHTVFVRDNYTCQKCNKKGVALNAHHIKHFATHPDLRFDITNGVTLCKRCHIEIHRKNVKGSSSTIL